MSEVIDAGRKALVLVVDTDVDVCARIGEALSERGLSWAGATTIGEALDALRELDPAVVVMDPSVGLGFDGDLVRVVAASRSLFVISADVSEAAKVAAFDAGAQDYVGKPLGVKEVVARVGLLLQRAGNPMPKISAVGLVVDLQARRVTRAGVEIALAPREFALLACLARSLNEPVSTKQLLLDVWGPAVRRRTHYVHIHVGRIRSRIEIVPSRPVLVVTVPGVGYRLEGIQVIPNDGPCAANVSRPEASPPSDER